MFSYDDRKFLDLLSLDSINEIERNLKYPLEVYNYLNALGRILFGPNSNRNDWNYYEFVMASKEDKTKALEEVLKENVN